MKRICLCFVLMLVVTGCRAPDTSGWLPEMTGVEPPIAEALQQAADQALRQADDAGRWAHLGDLLFMHAWFDHARRAYAEAIAKGSEDPAVFYRRSKAASHVGRPEEASKWLARTLDRIPDYGPAYVFAGYLAIERGELDNARIAFERALELSPREAVAARELGQLAIREGDGAAACRWLERAISWRPDYAEAYQSLSQAYLLVGNLHLAQDYAIRTRSLPKRNGIVDPLGSPDLPPLGSEGLNTFGVQQISAGNLEAAEVAFREALRIEPESTQALYNLGTLLARAGRVDEAMPILNRAAEMRPSHPETRVNLGAACLQLGKLEEGRSHLEDALAINPDHLQGRYVLARSWAEAGETARAASLLEESDGWRTRAEIARLLAWMLLDSGRTEDARIILEQAPLSESDPRDLDLFAGLAAAEGRFSEAVALDRRAMYLAASGQADDIAATIRKHLAAHKKKRTALSGIAEGS